MPGESTVTQDIHTCVATIFAPSIDRFRAGKLGLIARLIAWNNSPKQDVHSYIVMPTLICTQSDFHRKRPS